MYQGDCNWGGHVISGGGPDSVMVKASELCSEVPGSTLSLRQSIVPTLSKLFTHIMPPSPGSTIWYRPKCREGNGSMWDSKLYWPTYVCDSGKICSKRMTRFQLFCFTLSAVYTDKLCWHSGKNRRENVHRGKMSRGNMSRGKCTTLVPN